MDLNPFEGVLKLQSTERTTVTVKLHRYNAQSVTEGGNKAFTSEWSASVSTVPRISTRLSSSVVEHKKHFTKLPVADQFEIPPSDEEATSANDRPFSNWKLELPFSLTIVRRFENVQTLRGPDYGNRIGIYENRIGKQ